MTNNGDEASCYLHLPCCVHAYWRQPVLELGSVLESIILHGEPLPWPVEWDSFCLLAVASGSFWVTLILSCAMRPPPECFQSWWRCTPASPGPSFKFQYHIRNAWNNNKHCAALNKRALLSSLTKLFCLNMATDRCHLSRCNDIMHLLRGVLLVQLRSL